MVDIQFWEDREKKLISRLLLSEEAEKLARRIAEDHILAKKNKKNTNTNTRTQIRKFYDEVIRLKMESDNLDNKNGEEIQKWNSILALVNMMVAKAAYAKGRDLVSDNFLNFIRNSVKEIREKEDLKLFATFFEAFMGFYTLHGPKN